MGTLSSISKLTVVPRPDTINTELASTASVVVLTIHLIHFAASLQSPHRTRSTTYHDAGAFIAAPDGYAPYPALAYLVELKNPLPVWERVVHQVWTDMFNQVCRKWPPNR